MPKPPAKKPTHKPVKKPAKKALKPAASLGAEPAPLSEDEVEQGDFRARVLEVIRRIPAGKVATYGQVSKLAGHPRAARQVGRILYGLKDHERDVPWQRVINAQGSISTWRVGVGELQEAMLRAEGVDVRKGHCDLSRYGWEG